MGDSVKHIIFLFFFLSLSLSPTFVNSQNFADKSYYLVDSLVIKKLTLKDKKLIDSALVIYHKAKNDTLKIKAIQIIIAECWNDEVWPKYNQWIYEFTKKKLETFSDSLQNVANKNLRKRLLIAHGDAISNIGYLKNNTGEIVLALEYFKKSLNIAEQVDDKKGKATILNNIGSIYDNQGNITEALDYYERARIMHKQVGNKLGMAITINNLGYVYSNQENYQKALEYFTKSMLLQKDIGDKDGVAASLNNIGHIKERFGELTKALEYYNESLQISEAIENKDGIVRTLNKIGKIHETQNNSAKAMSYYTKSLKLSRAGGLKKRIASSLNNIGNLYNKEENISEAKKYAYENLKVAQEIGYPTYIKDAAELMDIIYKKEDNWVEAYKMKDLFIVMRDSLLNIEAKEAVIRQQANYEIEKKEQEIKLLASENIVLIKNEEAQELKLNKRKTLIILFSIAFSLVLILAIALYKGYKKKQVINELLERQKEEVIRKNEEKKAMLKEIHHRVKNNLQVVNSLLKLQSRGIEDKHVVAMFKEAQNRVLSMALLHEKMYKADDLKRIDVREHFVLLVKDLVDSYAVGKNIKKDIKIEELDIGMRTLVPLGLIINEIITNALKYAFESSNEGEIMVHIKSLNEVEYEMVLGDNGLGMVEKEESNGIGKKLIQIFVKQLNGEIVRLSRQGTIYKIKFEKIG